MLIPSLIVIGLVLRDDPGKLFGEGKPGTIASVVLLAGAGLVSIRMGRRLAPLAQGRLWLALGCLFWVTAVDDMFKLHERLDHLLIWTFDLDPEGPADKLDDLIVAAYAFPAALVALSRARSQLLRLPWTIYLFAAAACAFGVMVLFDALALSDSAEESAKIIAGALIFGAVAAAEHAPITQRLFARAVRLREAARATSSASADLANHDPPR